MADQRDVVAGLDGEFHVLPAAVAVGDRAHVEIICQDEMPVEPELVAQKPADDARRKRGREIRIDVRKLDVREHDRIQLRHQRGVGNHVLAQQFLQRGR